MSVSPIIFIIAAAIVIALTIHGILSVFHPRFSGISYRLTNNSVDITFYFYTYKIPFENITNVEMVPGRHILSWLPYVTFTGGFISRWWGKAIEIEFEGRRRLKSVLITPDNADDFLGEVKKHLSRSNSGISI